MYKRTVETILKMLLTVSILVISSTSVHSAPIHVTTSAQAKAAWGNGGSAHAGDTVWVHGGTYVGAGYVNVSGSSSAPIIVRNWNNERAIIDAGTNPAEGSGGMFIEAGVHDIWFWGLELQSFGTDRVSTSTGSAIPTDINISNGVFTKQSAADIVGVRFINMQVHDVQQGFSWWKETKNSEVYGTLIYNIGWQSPDRGHGHGIYTQNQTGRKTIADNIMFNGFSHNIHAYGSADAIVDNITVDGNISFNAAYLATIGSARNILIGTPAQSGIPRSVGDTVRNNHAYFTPTTGGDESGNFGYSKGHDGITIINNWFTTKTGGAALNLVNSVNVTMTGNRFYGGTNVSSTYPSNSYNTNTPAGGDTSFVRPNKYEAGRANIVVYNWAGADSVLVDVSAIMSPGSTYKIYNAQNFYGDPTFNGTYTGGRIKVPMRSNRWTVAPPNGWTAPPSTFPKFGAFVIMRQSGSGVPSPSGSLFGTPDTLPIGGGSSTLTWTSQNATSASINQGIGSVAVSGNMSVQVTATKTFTLTLVGTGGTTNYSKTIVVLAPPPPPAPSGTFTGNPDTLVAGGGNTTLTWTSQNAASASINQGIGSVSVSGSTNVQVTTTKVFTLTFTGTGGTMNYSKTIVVLASPPPPPAAPVLASPASGSTGLATTVTLQWNASSGATTYRLQVAPDSAFASPVFNDSTITGTSRSVTSLTNQTKYYWRVRAKNAAGTGAYSAVWNFTTTAGVGGQGPQDITSTGTPVALVTNPTGGGNHDINVVRDGVAPPVGSSNSQQQYDTYTGGAVRPLDWIGYTFSSAHTFEQVDFQEGMQFNNGGWFTSLNVQVRVAGQWVNVQNFTSTPAYTGGNTTNFETYQFTFAPIAGDGIRIAGTPGGTGYFVSVGELRVLANDGPQTSVVTLAAPNGGENWISGSVNNITWTSASVASVNIFYTTSPTGNWISIAQNVPASAGAYAWTVPGTPTTQARVKIVDAQNAAVDSSDGYFTIATGQIPQDITSLGAPVALIPVPRGSGNGSLRVISDDVFPAVGSSNAQKQYDTWNGGGARTFDWIGYQFASTYTFTAVKFQEGINFWDGGWFSLLKVQVRVGGVWTDVQSLVSAPAYAGNNGVNFETFNLTFAPIAGDGIRIAGTPGGSGHFISLGELRAFATAASTPAGIIATGPESGKIAILPATNGQDVPAEFSLGQNYPNPFNPTTTIEFALPANSHVKLEVYNMLGARVATLVDELRSTGRYAERFDAGRIASGTYFYRIEVQATDGAGMGNVVAVKKFTLVK